MPITLLPGVKGLETLNPSTLFSATARQFCVGTGLGKALYDYLNMSLSEKGSDQPTDNPVIAPQSAPCQTGAWESRTKSTVWTGRRGMLMELEKNWSRLWLPGQEAGRLACNFFWNGQVEAAFASSGKWGKFM